jgi:hypothetical protein
MRKPIRTTFIIRNLMIIGNTERFLSTGFPWCMKIWTYPFLIEYIVCEAVSSTSRVNGLDSCNGRLADTLIGTFKKAALKSLANLHNIRPE